MNALDHAFTEMRTDPDLTGLALDDEQLRRFLDEAEVLVRQYFRLEDPTTVHAVGLELRLAAPVGDLELRASSTGSTSRDDGELVVVDYKTGRPPSVRWEQRSLAGVQSYAFLCEQVLGRRPAAVRLVYLSTGEVIEAQPSAQSTRFVRTRATAIWNAVDVAVRHRLPPAAQRPGRDVHVPDVVPGVRRRSGANSGRERTGDGRGDVTTADDTAPDVPPQVAVAPGRSAFGPAIAKFDRWADIALERARGNPLADTVMMTATKLGDFSLIWQLVNVSGRGARRPGGRGARAGHRHRRREPRRQPGAQAPLPTTPADHGGRPQVPGAPTADVVVPVGARRRGGVHRGPADDVGRQALGAAVVEPRRDRRGEPGVRSASTTRPTSSPAWPRGPPSGSAPGRSCGGRESSPGGGR